MSLMAKICVHDLPKNGIDVVFILLSKGNQKTKTSLEDLIQGELYG